MNDKLLVSKLKQGKRLTFLFKFRWLILEMTEGRYINEAPFSESEFNLNNFNESSPENEENEI